MTQSTLNSPWYQAMMAQVLRGPQRGPQYPAEAGLNAVGDLAQALQMKWMTEKGEAKDAATQSDNTNAYASALNNLGSKDNSTWDVGGGMDASGDPGQINVSPAVNASPAQRMAAALRGSPEMAQQMGPELAKQLTAPHPMSLGPTGQAYDPLSLKPGDSPFGDPRIKSPEQLAQEAQEKAAPGPAQQPDAPYSDERMQQLLAIAQARGTQAGNVQSVQQAADGSLIVVHRDGKIEHMNLDGSAVKGTQAPEAVFNRSAAQAGGKAAGTAAEALPTVSANFDVINQTLDAFNDPAVKGQAGKALGFGGLLPTIPGVNSDFKARVGQLQGQTFLQAFNTLRGGGQITEVEGAKATDAIARLQKAQTPDEFYGALRDAKQTFSTLFQAAKTRAGRGAVVPSLQSPPAAAAGGIEDLVNQYKTKTP